MSQTDTENYSSQRAVVLLSGGLDSVTALAMAQEAGHECYALSIDYGQRHSAELDAARAIGRSLKVAGHRVVGVDLTAIGGSALTEAAIAVPEHESTGIPVTYVPARNTVMLSLALGYAETLEANYIFIGANAVDYSGYPDCRPEFIEAFERLANVATKAAVEGQAMHIEAPLIAMTKADIIRTGLKLGINYATTVSCYQADDEGAACGVCDSCRLRRQGFEDAGVADPTCYR
ncbi:MAG: 7-cyano-7-deazaguanine synthase QueC [Gammaproteobacteria bacterium]